MKTKSLRILLVPTTRTDLMCVWCGGFHTDFAVVNEAVTDAGTGANYAESGVHKGCIKRVTANRRQAKKRDITKRSAATSDTSPSVAEEHAERFFSREHDEFGDIGGDEP